MDSLWVVSNEGKGFYFDIGEEAVEYCNNNGINFDEIYQVFFHRKMFYGLMNCVEVKKDGKTIRYLRIGRNKIECCEVGRSNRHLVDSKSSDYQDLYAAFNSRGIDIDNVSDYTLFFYKGFVFDYSRESMEYLKDKIGVYRVDYYRKLDGVDDVICYFNRDRLSISMLIYSDALLGYRVLDKDGKPRPFIDGQYLTCEDIDNWYSVLNGKNCCIRVSKESLGEDSIFMLESRFINSLSIEIGNKGLLRRVFKKS